MTDISFDVVMPSGVPGPSGSHFPARTTVQVAALPGGVGVEIDAIAFRRSP